MDKLIQDVLQYSRLARSELRLAPVDVQVLLRGIIESYPSFQPPQVEIQIEGPLPRMMGNEAALTQCFSNLLGNAIKFVVPGTRPTVRVWAERVENRKAEARKPARVMSGYRSGLTNHQSPISNHSTRNTQHATRSTLPPRPCPSPPSASGSPTTASASRRTRRSASSRCFSGWTRVTTGRAWGCPSCARRSRRWAAELGWNPSRAAAAGFGWS